MADQNNPQATYDAAQKEKQQKFKKDFAIESSVHGTRLRQEKQEAQWEAKRRKDAERAEDERIRKQNRPAPRRSKQSGSSLLAHPARAPAFKQADFLPNIGGASPFRESGSGGHGMGLPDFNPMNMSLPQFEMGVDAPPYRKKGKAKKRGGDGGVFSGGFDPNYIPPQLRQFF